jgi:DNA-binding CsgD family transcriptional regulator
MFSADRPITSPVLVGRTREVEMLDAALRAVRQDRGQVVLLAGEAGVGKSRLIAEIRRHAERDSFTILEGHCFEHDLVFPYAPLIDALRTFLTPASPQDAVVTAADLLGPLAAELVKLLPELALAIPNVQPTPALDPEAEKRRLFETLVQFLIKLTQAPRNKPLLLIFEDLHWCDETSLDFLHLIARRITAHPIFVLATYRGEEISPHLRHWLAQLGRGRLAHEVALSPLTQSDVSTMLHAIFDQRRPVRAEFLEMIYALTEGNPFFIEEVLQALIAAGGIFYADGGWNRKFLEELNIPPSVQEAVQRRTAQLNATARQVLTLAAVAGQRFDFALLLQVTGREEHELLALIKELMAAQLVVEVTSERFAFRHALTRQAVCAELLGRERKALHQKVGEAIERLYANELDAYVTDLSYHFSEAGQWAKALNYAERAGEKAQALYAPHAAVEHYSRALAAARQGPQAAQRVRLYRARGLAYETLGAFEQARADLEAALELARVAGDQPAEWQALVDLGKLWASRNYTQTGDFFQRALELARALNNPATLAHSLNRVGNWYTNVERSQDALRCHQEALAIFQSLKDRRGLAQTFDLLGLTHLLSGDPVQSAAQYGHSVALFEALDDRQGLASSLANLARCGANYASDTVVPAAMNAAGCRQCAERATRIAREIGWRSGEAFGLILTSYSLAAQGQCGQALASIQRGLEIAEEIEHRQWMSAAHRNLGALYLDLLALPAARRHLEQALALAKEIGSVYFAQTATSHLISAAIAEQDFGEAEALLDADYRPDLPMQTLAQRGIWRARAELALAQKEPDLALQIIDRLIASAANIDKRDAGAIPYLAKLQGEALAALERWAEAEAILQAALATAQAQGTLRLLWPLHMALGKVFQAQARYEEAAHAWTHARRIVDEIAATVLDVAVRDNFVRRANALLPQRQTTSLQTARQTYGGLTRREREVAALIAEGRSNREIAEALVLGERTVESHVSSILAKLGFTKRAQIAVWAVEIGLARGDG